jgi:ribosomal protein S17E
MGKIKLKAIKRSVKELMEKGVKFSENFEENKKILGNAVPSKKIRNQMAGYAVRLKKYSK